MLVLSENFSVYAYSRWSAGNLSPFLFVLLPRSLLTYTYFVLSIAGCMLSVSLPFPHVLCAAGCCPYSLPSLAVFPRWLLFVFFPVPYRPSCYFSNFDCVYFRFVCSLSLSIQYIFVFPLPPLCVVCSSFLVGGRFYLNLRQWSNFQTKKIDFPHHEFDHKSEVYVQRTFWCDHGGHQ